MIIIKIILYKNGKLPHFEAVFYLTPYHIKLLTLYKTKRICQQ
jgi:hypothetical protein